MNYKTLLVNVLKIHYFKNKILRGDILNPIDV